jgi:hypothetical protein
MSRRRSIITGPGYQSKYIIVHFGYAKLCCKDNSLIFGNPPATKIVTRLSIAIFITDTLT